MAPRASKLLDALLAGIIGFIMAAVLGMVASLIIYGMGWWALLPAAFGAVLSWAALKSE